MSHGDNYTHFHFIDVTDDDGNLFDYHFYIRYPKVRDGGWVVSPPKGYKRVRLDKHGKEHIHIFKNGEYVVIYVDGTRRHGNGSIKIPKKLYDWITKNFPYFDLPDDRVIHFRRMSIPKYDLHIIIDIENGVYYEVS